MTALITGVFPLTASAQTAIQRDPQALMILDQTIAAGGGQSLITSIQDLTETGNVTYYLGDSVTGSVTVKSRGLRQFRTDAALPGGLRSTVVNGNGGSQIDVDGTFRPIVGQSASDLGSMTLPYLPLIAAIQDSSIEIIYGGLTTQNGASAYDIRIQQVYSAQQDPSGTRGAREARDFYIDPNSLLVVGISDQLCFGNASDQGIPHEILYSNYQSENGIAVPMTVSESVRGITGVTMQFSQVTVNSGLTDSDFDD